MISGCSLRIEGIRCGEPAEFYRGSSGYCAKHHRHYKMRKVAKERGLLVPTHRQLELLTPPKMICHECDKPMIWSVRAGEPRAQVASLQHYDDGTLAIIHLGCNVAHKNRKEGRPEHERAPEGTKFCPGCDDYKPAEAFYVNIARRDGLSSRCRKCKFAAGKRTYVASYVAAEGKARKHGSISRRFETLTAQSALYPGLPSTSQGDT